MGNLEGKITLVTGATRGVGKGIAVGLGEAGATVYITGRTLEEKPDKQEISGCLKDTQLAVEKAGGICIPVQVDHSNDEEVKLLFERIQDDHGGQLNLLVNNVYAGVQALRDNQGKPFWENEPSLWDACNNVGLRSHYVASIFAARMMTQNNQGLICNISSWGGMSYIFGAAYGAGKAACDRLAADMAVELKDHNVACVSLWPGIVGTEHIKSFAEEMAASDDRDEQILGTRDSWETPLLTGRAIAALAAEPDIMSMTGRVHIVAEIAQRYGLTDYEGNLPPSLRSLRFILPYGIPALRQYSSLIPDLKVPWFLLLLAALKSPKV